MGPYHEADSHKWRCVHSKNLNKKKQNWVISLQNCKTQSADRLMAKLALKLIEKSRCDVFVFFDKIDEPTNVNESERKTP